METLADIIHRRLVFAQASYRKAKKAYYCAPAPSITALLDAEHWANRVARLTRLETYLASKTSNQGQQAA